MGVGVVFRGLEFWDVNNVNETHQTSQNYLTN